MTLIARHNMRCPTHDRAFNHFVIFCVLRDDLQRTADDSHTREGLNFTSCTTRIRRRFT